MKRSILASVLAALLLISAPGHAGVSSPEKEQVIRRLLELTGAEAMGRDVFRTLLEQMRPSFPQVSDSQWSEIVASFDPAEVIALTVVVYDRHFTLDELQAMVDFYETPVGQQILQKFPLVMQESALLSHEWGVRKGEELLQRLAERGFEPVGL